MYNLVSRITDGLGELKKLLETHIHNQGLAAIEKCGETALNVRVWGLLGCAWTLTPAGLGLHSRRGSWVLPEAPAGYVMRWVPHLVGY